MNEEKESSETEKGRPLKDYLGEFNEATGKVSEITRNLSLAGIAIIWLFKNPENADKVFPPDLIFPLKWIVVSLILDLLQYIYKTVALKIFHRHNETLLLDNKISESDAKKLLYPTILENITWFFFIGKIIAMMVGYIAILIFLSGKI